MEKTGSGFEAVGGAEVDIDVLPVSKLPTRGQGPCQRDLSRVEMCPSRAGR